MPDEPKTPVHVHCIACRESWIIAYLPLEAGRFTQLLKTAAANGCIRCGSQQVAMGRPPAEPIHDAPLDGEPEPRWKETTP